MWCERWEDKGHGVPEKNDKHGGFGKLNHFSFSSNKQTTKVSENVHLAADVNAAADRLAGYVNFLLKPTAWRFSDTPPHDSITFPDSRWTCLFAMMKKIQAGSPLSFTGKATGCPGAGFYLGLHDMPLMGASIYLSALEKLKKDVETATAFYLEVKPVFSRDATLIYQCVNDIPGNEEIEVVNLWVGADSLASLLTLANYDRPTNDNVIMPFASGCQSIWTLPYKEKASLFPRAVAGSLDPTVRRFIPQDALSLAVPANRFLEMCSNIEGSFLGSGSYS